MHAPISEDSLREAGVGAYFKPKDVLPLGVSYRQIQDWVAKGTVERLGSGLYRWQNFEPDENETIAMVAAAVPKAILCLLTALRIHEIGTQVPHQVWIALDRKARKPGHLPAKVRIIRYSGAMLTYGIETGTFLGRQLSITSPARTVVDCFRYRNKIGVDVAVEALRDTLRSRKATVSEINRAAEVCRIRTVVTRYLETI